MSSPSRADEPRGTLRPIQELAEALHAAKVQYCLWKGSVSLREVARGKKDLDLLVAAADWGRFRTLLGRLGFKEALLPSEGIPALQHHYAYDEETGRLVHVHAGSHLLVGQTTRGVYRLPIEVPLLSSAIAADPFTIPQPEFEYITFVVRMLLGRSRRQAFIPWAGGPYLAPNRQYELEYLRSRVDVSLVHEVLLAHLPRIGGQLFEACERALDPGCSGWDRARITWRLHGCVDPWSPRSRAVQLGVAAWRRLDRGIRRRLGARPSKGHLVKGGVMIAFVGGDGAGKSTAINALSKWLGTELATRRVHLGRPPWSWTTRVVRGVFKGQRLASEFFRRGGTSRPPAAPRSSRLATLARHVCRARDRYLEWLVARRYADGGDVVFCDRFPLTRPVPIDGPILERLLTAQPTQGPLSRWLDRWLVRMEHEYYQGIEEPDALIVLRVPPGLAAARKVEEEPLRVRERALAVWDADWSGVGALLIDASRPIDELRATLRSVIWSKL